MAKKEKQAKVSFTYDRLWEQKLSQVYHLLVPNNPVISTEHSITELIEDSAYENSCNIYEGILLSTERG
jgi:acetylornithine deacetylase/succinyl-diaminopimelate desuccinylase-like protein